jgi:hypothetical protein
MTRGTTSSTERDAYQPGVCDVCGSTTLVKWCPHRDPTDMTNRDDRWSRSPEMCATPSSTRSSARTTTAPANLWPRAVPSRSSGGPLEPADLTAGDWVPHARQWPANPLNGTAFSREVLIIPGSWVRAPPAPLFDLEVRIPCPHGAHGRGAGSHACCGVRSGSLSRLAARVAGDAVRRGQVQAERRMKARSSTSSPMERP